MSKPVLDRKADRLKQTRFIPQGGPANNQTSFIPQGGLARNQMRRKAVWLSFQKPALHRNADRLSPKPVADWLAA
jgi:hypothetical protein